jgi:hypothetical protein
MNLYFKNHIAAIPFGALDQLQRHLVVPDHDA